VPAAAWVAASATFSLSGHSPSWKSLMAAIFSPLQPGGRSGTSISTGVTTTLRAAATP